MFIDLRQKLPQLLFNLNYHNSRNLTFDAGPSIEQKSTLYNILDNWSLNVTIPSCVCVFVCVAEARPGTHQAAKHMLDYKNINWLHLSGEELWYTPVSPWCQ